MNLKGNLHGTLPDDAIIDNEDTLEDDENDDAVESFYSSDENGYWESNTIFNEEGVAIDYDGNSINNDDYLYKDDFDYSPFEIQDDEDTNER